MGMFLSLSGVIGKTTEQVSNSLRNFAHSVKGGLDADSINSDQENYTVIREENNNTTILYPNDYLEWDNSSGFISRELQTSVFSCHIHDGDLWMFVLYNNGKIVAQFNPIPEYWDYTISKEERDNWKGDANTISKYVPSIKPEDIEKYFRHWGSEDEAEEKAYTTDEFTFGTDWQLLDFMKKLGLPYPLTDEGKPNGKVFKLWTSQLKLK